MHCIYARFNQSDINFHLTKSWIEIIFQVFCVKQSDTFLRNSKFSNDLILQECIKHTKKLTKFINISKIN